MSKGLPAHEIRYLVTTQRVQTNEVGRCSGLLPAFSHLSRKLADQSLALVEIGTSAGLHLLWDRYNYDYGPAGRTGGLSSPVEIVATPQGALYPPVPARLPAITYRIGLDLHPIDVRDEEATRWLRALIWPEHKDRMQQLDAALQLARHNPPKVVEGNAAEMLPDLLAQVPQNAVLCLYHSYTLNQMPRIVREQILQHIADFSQQRDLYRISQEDGASRANQSWNFLLITRERFNGPCWPIVKVTDAGSNGNMLSQVNTIQKAIRRALSAITIR